jgi:hypothetical protein
MASLSFTLNEDQRRQIDAAVAGLTGEERQRARARLRSRLLREDPAFRQADNAAKAEHGREAYHANLEESRRRNAEKWRRYRARDKARTPTESPDV